MIYICPSNKCTGCSACQNICPVHAIKMVMDKCGYIHPNIDQQICINCNQCVAVCPVNNKVKLNYPQNCYAATAKDDVELLSCASGGMATEFSKFIIKNGGIVYGCTGKDIRNVHHIRIDDFKDIVYLKGSKYVQSFIGETYNNIKRDLQSNKLVLFIGTPCQVAGLQSFLKNKEYPNLILIDLVCHGVPSQKMLNDDLSLYCSSSQEEITLKFREKGTRGTKGSLQYRIMYGLFYKISHVHSQQKIRYYRDPYMFGFLRGLTFRRSCYSCRYACISRCGDFTLGDFWGLGHDAGFDNGKGVSLVLVNTRKAEKLWREISENCRYVSRDVVEAQSGNGQLQCPSKMHHNYDKFISLYPQIGFKSAIHKCLRMDYLIIFFLEIKKILKKCVQL